MKLTCKHCEQEIKNQKKAKSYDWYYFCNNECISRYIELNNPAYNSLREELKEKIRSGK